MNKANSRGIFTVCLVTVLVLTGATASCKSGGTKATLGDRILLADNIELDEGDIQTIFSMEPPPGSFNDYGYYLSPRFFLSPGDTIQVIITADAPISLSGSGKSQSGGLQTGLNSIGEEDEPTTNIDFSYFTMTTATNANDLWEVIYTFPAKRVPESYYQIPPGYYQLNVFNDSGQEAHCQFTITLLQP